jgi:ribosomal protein S18 acetylase RimI-like enzyme
MTLRQMRDEDFDAVHDLYASVEQAAYGKPETTTEELRTWFTAPTVDVETDVRLAVDGDEVVGYVDVDRVDADPPRWWTDVRVRPGRDTAALVPELLGWATERANERAIHRVWAPSTLADMRSAFERLGFERVRASYRMEIDLGAELPPPASEGIEIRAAREGEERIAYDIHQASFRDSWEHVEEPYEEWAHYLVRQETFDRSLWFIAWDGDWPAGVAICRMREGVGWVGILGVLREWRRRGIGRALLLHAFHEFKRRGLPRAGLGVDAESLTGANRLYESAGMHVVRQLDFFEKQLAPAAA